MEEGMTGTSAREISSSIVSTGHGRRKVLARIAAGKVMLLLLRLRLRLRLQLIGSSSYTLGNMRTNKQ
jgi:hypothetical protein